MRPYVRFSLIYATLGVIWVLVSNSLLHRLLSSQPAVLIMAQIANGWLLVGCTALLLVYLLRKNAAVHDHLAQTVSEGAAELRQARETLQHYQADYDRLQMERAKESEQQATRSRFLSTLAHDFRTPLASIFAAAELLDHYDQRLTAADRLRHYNIIRDQVRREIDMLDDMLFIMRSDKSQQDFKPQMLDLVSLCHTRIAELQPQVRPLNEIQFQSTLNTCIFSGDERLLRQMLGNMITNAAKYTPKGGTIDVSLSDGSGVVRIQVKDAGIGVPADDQERIFQAFTRGSNIGSISGAGLGLAIVRQVVELHKGSIHLESVVDQGSTFTVTFPTTNNR
jgi:signal transduction histidine kinase